MKVTERTYSSQVFRPRPEVYSDSGGELCLIVTPWGPRGTAKRTIQTITDFFHSSSHGQESTSPFQKLTCLTPLGNMLRVAIMLANDNIYREENRSEYVAGVELLAIARAGNEVAWVQIGQPSLWLDRAGRDLQPLTGCLDLSQSLSPSSQLLAPLPGELLGTASTSNISVHHLFLQPGDRLLAIARSALPARLFAIPYEQRRLDTFTQILSRHSADLPFWLAQILPDAHSTST